MYRCQKDRLARLGVVLALVGAIGCSAAKETANDGEQAVINENWDAAVFYYLQAVTEDPQNVEYRMQLGRARQKASQAHFRKGMTLREMGRLHSARDEIQMAVQLDPVNQFAEQFLDEVHRIVLSTPNDRGKGVFWWEPASGRGGGRTLFDRGHNALPAMTVFDRFTRY